MQTEIDAHRLRLWIERGIAPADALRQSLVYAVARIFLAALWLWQGIVPKLIFMHPDELSMLHAAGVASSASRTLLAAFGWAELAIGLSLLFGWRWRWPLWLTIVTMPLVIVGVAITSPAYLKAPFNPVTLNLGLIALALIGLLTDRNRLPSAGAASGVPPTEAT